MSVENILGIYGEKKINGEKKSMEKRVGCFLFVCFLFVCCLFVCLLFFHRETVQCKSSASLFHSRENAVATHELQTIRETIICIKE